MAPRSTGAAHGNKVKITISVDPSLYEAAKKLAGPGERYSSVSHVIERGIKLVVADESLMSAYREQDAIRTKGQEAPGKTRTSTSRE